MTSISNTQQNASLLTFHLPSQLKDRLRAAGKQTGECMSAIATTALAKYLDDHGHFDQLPGRDRESSASGKKTIERVRDILWANAQVVSDSHSGETNPVVRATMKEIAAKAGLSVPTITRAYQALEQIGDIVRGQRRGWGGAREIFLRTSDPAADSKTDSTAIFGKARYGLERPDSKEVG